MWIALTPTLSQRERERERERKREEVKPQAERSDGLSGLHLPLWPCREAQGVGRARQRSMPRIVL